MAIPHIVATLAQRKHTYRSPLMVHFLILKMFNFIRSQISARECDLKFNSQSNELLLLMRLSIVLMNSSNFIWWHTRAAKQIPISTKALTEQNAFTNSNRLSLTSIEKMKMQNKNILKLDRRKPIAIFQLNRFDSFGLMPTISNFSKTVSKISIFLMVWWFSRSWNMWDYSLVQLKDYWITE